MRQRLMTAEEVCVGTHFVPTSSEAAMIFVLFLALTHLYCLFLNALY